MSVQVEKLEKNTAKLTIEVPAEELDKAIQKAYLKDKNKFSVPGFRKGKVPRALIEKMYGAGVFYEAAADTLLQEQYPIAAEESGLEILTRPEVEITQIEKGKPFIFTALVAVYPEVTLGQYKGIEVPIQDREVTDDEVEAELKREQEKNSRSITLDEEPAAKGDKVTFDYAGSIDGVPFEGGSAENHTLELGSGYFIPGFEDQLIGVKAGEEKEVNVTFPDNYHAEELRSKEAVFLCTIHKVERKELPELDDDFAQDVSEFDTLEEYKASLKKDLEERKAESAKRAKENAAVMKAGENSEIELSEMMISDQANRMVEQYAQRLSSQGLDIRQYCQMMGTTVEQMVEDAKTNAEEHLRTQFTLEKVAEAEKLEVTDEYLDEKLGEMAASYNLEKDKLKEILTDDYLDQMKKELLSGLAAEFIGENAVETQAATDAEKEKLEQAAKEAADKAVEDLSEEKKTIAEDTAE